jgi:hypothetical protein
MSKMKKSMKRLLCLTVATVMAVMAVAWISVCSGGNKKSAQAKSNGIFEMISCRNDSVKFKAVAETKFYSLALVSGSSTVEAKTFSNSVDTVRWANGSRFWPGSTMSLPSAFGVGAMTLPAGTVITVYKFSLPENFKAEKIRIVTEEGAKEMFYDISKSSWDR